jgi:uncharacterized tellurite resistance protein B-like protein
MKNKATLSKLFFLLASVDGSIKPKEEAIGTAMCSVEGIGKDEFAAMLQNLRTKNAGHIFTESINELKKMSREDQVRSIAWMCMIANADGFMEKVEWQLIYKVYHKELNLPLEEVLNVQKTLGTLSRPYLMATV